MDPLELAEHALAFTDGPAQVTVIRERRLLARFARSVPAPTGDLDRTAVTFLAWHDGRTATATTTRLDDDSLRAAASRARAAVRAAADGGAPGDHPGLPEPQPITRPADGFDLATAQLDPAGAVAALGAAFAATAASRLEASGAWAASDAHTAIASTTGIRVAQRLTDAHLEVVARDPATGRSGAATGAAVAAGDLDAAAIAGRAAAKVLPGEPAELEPGRYPVVLEAPAVGTLLTLLGRLAFDGLAHAQGRGALTGRLGTRVTAANINLSDAPRYARTLPRSFDAEGVPKAPLPLVQDGVAHRVLHDTRSAAVAGGGARSTGHAAAPGGASEGPRAGNLVLVGGGAADEAELCAPIERGVYVTRLGQVSVVDERETLLTGVTRDGTFLIEDGRIAGPLRDVRFTDSVLRILEHTEALTMASRLEATAERPATGVVCPSLRASGFQVTG